MPRSFPSCIMTPIMSSGSHEVRRSHRYHPAPFNALLWHWNQIRPVLSKEEFELLKAHFRRFVECIPYGVGGYPVQFEQKDFTLKPSARMRQELLKREDGQCFTCERAIHNGNFVLHHTDYSAIEDLSTIHVMCPECHHIAHCITGFFMIWFRAMMGLADMPGDRLVRGKDGTEAWQKGL